MNFSVASCFVLCFACVFASTHVAQVERNGVALDECLHLSVCNWLGYSVHLRPLLVEGVDLNLPCDAKSGLSLGNRLLLSLPSWQVRLNDLVNDGMDIQGSIKNLLSHGRCPDMKGIGSQLIDGYPLSFHLHAFLFNAILEKKCFQVFLDMYSDLTHRNLMLPFWLVVKATGIMANWSVVDVMLKRMEESGFTENPEIGEGAEELAVVMAANGRVDDADMIKLVLPGCKFDKVRLQSAASEYKDGRHLRNIEKLLKCNEA